jgi:pyruvate ferredoxin oxidoreductase gamma subunit
MVTGVRFHGRGGQGVKLASRVVSRAAFLAGRRVQDAPLYGAERRGAPVVAFVRLASGEPIAERGWIERPDAVVLMDDSLLAQPEAGVLDGVDAATLVVANTRHTGEEIRTRLGVAAEVVAVDLSALALALLGRHLLAAPVAGLTVKATGAADWDGLARALVMELAEAGVAPRLVAANVAAARQAFDAAAVCHPLPVGGRRAARASAKSRSFRIPRLPAAVAAPSVLAAANSALQHTAGWRVTRPVVDLPRCTRCLLCFALCPEGAIGLDAAGYPVVDYDHCKGCLVCATECPPAAITEQREPAV